MGQRKNDGILPGEVEDYRPSTDGGEGSDEVGPDSGDMKWLKLARETFRASTDYLDDSIRSKWEDSLRRFHSEHARGSKYLSPSYRNRSKIFRPKTRSASRRAEATAAKALFSNGDLIDVRGQNAGSAAQAASALVAKELIQYRLEHSIPWFVTAMGARQDTFNHGICISLSTWKYEEQISVEHSPLFDEMGNPEVNELGEELGEEIESRSIRHDKPIIDLIPPENLRFDPNADWRDPIEDSPSLTIMLPMYAGDVLQKMKVPNPVTGIPEWREYSLAQVLSSATTMDNNETIRQAREGTERQDAMDTNQYNEFTMVWVHLNIMRDDGDDYCYYTLGTRLMLTDPVPVKQVLPLGRESLTVGFSIVEAHRNYPIGGNELGAPLQKEINEVTNQRMDNVKLALNKRFILRRNANIDQAALMRSVPGGGIMAGDPEKDIRVLDYKDVTSSSYQEQDRLAQEQDELVGTFSGSSVQANRQLNETVGGMNLLQGDAMNVAEYELRTWIETWVEPVLRKLYRLEAMFETDETILAIAAENSEAFIRYGKDIQVDALLDQDLVISVNVGMGNTDPMQKLQKVGAALNTLMGVPEIAQTINGHELGKEVFSILGFSEGERFILSEEKMKERAEQEAAAQQQPHGSVLLFANDCQFAWDGLQLFRFGHGLGNSRFALLL